MGDSEGLQILRRGKTETLGKSELRRTVVVDGHSVTAQNPPDDTRILLALDWCLKRGLCPLIILSPSGLRSDTLAKLEKFRLQNGNKVLLRPKSFGRKDEIIDRLLQETKRRAALIFTYRSYSQHLEQPNFQSWALLIKSRILKPSYVGDEVSISIDGPLGRHGADLEQVLSCAVDVDNRALPEDELHSIRQYQLSPADQQSLAAIVKDGLEKNSPPSSSRQQPDKQPQPELYVPPQTHFVAKPAFGAGFTGNSTPTAKTAPNKLSHLNPDAPAFTMPYTSAKEERGAEKEEAEEEELEAIPCTSSASAVDSNYSGASYVSLSNFLIEEGEFTALVQDAWQPLPINSPSTAAKNDVDNQSSSSSLPTIPDDEAKPSHLPTSVALPAVPKAKGQVDELPSSSLSPMPGDAAEDNDGKESKDEKKDNDKKEDKDQKADKKEKKEVAMGSLDNNWLDLDWLESQSHPQSLPTATQPTKEETEAVDDDGGVLVDLTPESRGEADGLEVAGDPGTPVLQSPSMEDILMQIALAESINAK